MIGTEIVLKFTSLTFEITRQNTLIAADNFECGYFVVPKR